jgi:hypothetical protein
MKVNFDSFCTKGMKKAGESKLSPAFFMPSQRKWAKNHPVIETIT